MELIKKRIHYVREGKKIFDQFYVDEEYNVPEAKEDVRRIVDTGTELKIEEIRPVENYYRKAVFQDSLSECFFRSETWGAGRKTSV